MTITEAIKQLTGVLNEYGDLPLFIIDCESGSVTTPIFSNNDTLVTILGEEQISDDCSYESEVFEIDDPNDCSIEEDEYE